MQLAALKLLQKSNGLKELIQAQAGMVLGVLLLMFLGCMWSASTGFLVMLIVGGGLGRSVDVGWLGLG